TGLDPQARRNFWQLIQNIKRRGKTVLLTTHYMEEAELLCDQLVILDKGKIIAEGSPKMLLAQHFGCFFVSIEEQHFAATTDSFPEKSHRENGHIVIESRSVEATINQLIRSGSQLTSLTIRNPSLDDLFLKLTGSHLRE
ncbi:MAG: ABC transporter ATP-binding protein, partial [bacterium]